MISMVTTLAEISLVRVVLEYTAMPPAFGSAAFLLVRRIAAGPPLFTSFALADVLIPNVRMSRDE
jgi:hypothetical protein